MIWRCDLVPQYEKYRPEIDAAIHRVLSSGRYILAAEVDAFEKEFAAYLGSAHAIAVANGTDALTLALRAYDVGPGDEVITTPFTAIPTCSAIVDAGARPVFVDVDPDTFLIDIEQVAGAIRPATKAILPVHIFGNIVNIPRLREVVPSSIPIIEDACQSHGSTLRGRQSGALGDAGVFSFYPTKNLGAYGDGGMIVTNDPEVDRRLRRLRMYGMTDKDHIVTHGVNSRLDELQAAILRLKLRDLDTMNQVRNTIARRYIAAFGVDVLAPQRIVDGVFCNYHVFAARVRERRDNLVAFLEGRGIQTNVYYPLPLHLQEANASLGMKRGSLPAVERLCAEVIALPMYPEFPERLQRDVIEAISEFAVAVG